MKTPAADLAGTRWLHAFEEDTAEGEVYRPEAEDVPLSRRPRRRISFLPDGSARLQMPGPDDRLVETRGTWEREGRETIVRVESPGGAGQRLLRVSVRSPTRIVIRR